MKKAIVLLTVAIYLAGCNKDELKLSDKMNATISNAEWNSATRITVLNDNKFIITGTSYDGKSIAITIFGTQTGIYNSILNPTEFTAVYKESLTSSTEDAYTAISGEVELTNVNTSEKEISGTFSFTMSKSLSGSSVIIEDGVFNNLKYKETEQ